MTHVRRLLPFALAAAFLAAAPASAARRIWPGWVIDGAYSVSVPAGFKSLDGTFTFPLAGGDSTLTANYGDDGTLVCECQALVPDPGGFQNITFYKLTGTYSVDAVTSVQKLHLVDSTKSPGFVFDGDVAADANTVVGTFQRHDGFIGLTGEDSGPLTIRRTSGAVRTSFTLAIKARQDARGRLFGGVADDGKSELTAQVTLYGSRVDSLHRPIANVLAGGKIRGTVKTDKYALTTATVTITGPRSSWKAKLVGPVDAAGFHASCDFTGGGFTIHAAPVTLPVKVGAPLPIPPPPKNLLTGASATISNGKLTITHAAVPSRFFGTKARLTIELPASDAQAIVDGHAVVHADAASASLPDPDGRRCTVTIAGRDYGTAAAPGDVTLDLHQVVVQFGGAVEVLATGKVVAANGKTKNVSVLLDAVLQ